MVHVPIRMACTLGAHGHSHGGATGGDMEHGHSHGGHGHSHQNNSDNVADNINVRAAYIHVLGDMVQSVVCSLI